MSRKSFANDAWLRSQARDLTDWLRARDLQSFSEPDWIRSQTVELFDLYRKMSLARQFELAVSALWEQGLISGEMHLGTGEEAIAAGITAQMLEGDAMALDHRATPFLLLRGVPMDAILRELLGRPNGLCRGFGGHMHLFSREKLAASSGIVGSAAPLGAGFALAAKRLRPDRIAVATFGDGAMNQGMLLETLNLAVAWRLPLVFVCKDNGWAITTVSSRVTGGDLLERARAFGMPAERAEGGDPAEVYRAAEPAFERARHSGGPSFLLLDCARLDGHMLGDLALRVAEHPATDGRAIFGKTIAAALSRNGAGVLGRVSSMTRMMATLHRMKSEKRDGRTDPVLAARKRLERDRQPVDQADAEAFGAVESAVASALGGA